MWDFVTEFEGVWWKAQSLRRIDSSNVTSNLKLTDRRWRDSLSRRKKLINNTTIPQYQIEAIARCILPDILAFYDSEEGQRAFAAWQARKLTKVSAKGQISKRL